MADKATDKIEDAILEEEGTADTRPRRPTASEILKTRPADDAAEAANKEDREAQYKSYRERSKKKAAIYDNERSK